MNLHSPLLSPVRPLWARSALLSIIAAFSVHHLDAQVSYTTIGLARTIVWVSNYQATDLQAFVPADFVSSVA